MREGRGARGSPFRIEHKNLGGGWPTLAAPLRVPLRVLREGWAARMPNRGSSVFVQRLSALRLWFLVLAIALARVSVAQQSYRSYQQLSGRVLRNAQPLDKTPSVSPGLPMRFEGWNHQEKSRPNYLKRFSRPRARAARTEMLKNAARAAAHNSGLAAAFAPSALPGFLLRDSLPAGFIPTSVATGDFNGDGKQDFVVANGGDNNLWLYYGKGDGTFNLPVIVPVTLGQSPVWVATGDLRGNGRTDLVVAEVDSNSVGVFLNNGDGTFTESAIPLEGPATFLLVGDFNKDGKLDIVAPLNFAGNGASADYLVLLPGLGNGTFGAPIGTLAGNFAPSIIWAASADVNGDGYPDLLLLNDFVQDVAVQIYLNNKDGTFTAGQVVTTELYLSGLLFDANGDGIPDVVLLGNPDTLWVFPGNGDGTFNASNPGLFGVGDLGLGMVEADVNGDGHPDVIVAGTFFNVGGPGSGVEAGNQICVLEGDGKGNFGPPKVYRGDSSSASLAVGDFNGDGHPDVVTANQDNDSATVFLNDGTGGYGAPSGGWIGYNGLGQSDEPISGAFFADVDGNGSTDVSLVEFNQNPGSDFEITVLLNDGNGNLSAPIRSDAYPENDGAPTDFVLADFRNTGRPDFLAIAENDTPASVLAFAPNIGAGSFGPPTVTSVSNTFTALGVGDFNGDGKLDFVVAGLIGCIPDPNNCSAIQVFTGNGDGTFHAASLQTFGGTDPHVPVAIYVGDFNRDGKPDLLVFMDDNAGFTGDAALYEFLGNGDGTFQPAKLLFSNIGPMVVADVNGDGHPDIVNMPVVSSDVTRLQNVEFSIYIGQADGSFLLTNTYSYPFFPLLPQISFGSKLAPMVADFNGDGNLDIAAFEQIGGVNLDTVVQVLLGNGDGTFTPTNDVLDFRKPRVNAYATDLTGAGRISLFELNDFTSSYDLIPTAIAPTLQLGLAGDPVPGPQGSGIVLLDLTSTSATTVSLSASDPAIKVPATITIPAGSASQTFNFTIGPTFNTNHVFAITAQAGPSTAIAYGTAVAAGTAGFQVNAANGFSVNLAAGQSQENLNIQVSSVNGYASTLSIQCMGLSMKAQCTFTPPNLVLRPGDFAATRMAVSVAATTPQGSYPAVLQLSDGVITQNISLILNVGDFSLSLLPQILQVLPTDQNISYNLTVGTTNMFNQTVNLTCGGALPAGASCSVTSFIESPGTGANQAPVGIQTQGVPVGNYQITVTGTSAPVTHTTVAELQVSDFTASVSPTSASVAKGGSANFNVSVSPVNGFDGTVGFTCSSSSGLISCAFNPASTTVPANGTGTSVLTLTASSQAASTTQGPRNWSPLVRPLAVAFALPLGILLTGAKFRRKGLVIVFLAIAVCGTLSCGGASPAGGGGGGGSQNYSIVVMVSGGSSTTKTAGTITLTVN